MTIEIHTVQIEKLCKAFIEMLKKSNISTIDLDSDYYWTILDDDEKFDQSPETAIGSLIDDWQQLENILNNNRVFVPTDIHYLASILRNIYKEITK